VQLIYEAIIGWRSSPAHLRQISYLAAAGVLLGLGFFFLRLARRFHDEAKRTALGPPAQPPDFSKLSDGSQRVRNLENM